jgi:radical SAM superfamily enzyme YgiQ (UPF0313 family)
MNVLLTTLNAKYIHINLAIRLLYELNKEKHEGLDWKEFTIKENRDEIAQKCSGYDVVCFSCYIWNIVATLEVAQKIKNLNPTCKILLGGPEVSYDWEDVICRDEVDYIITGEGEIPFAEFLDNYPNVGHLFNIVRKENEQIIHLPKQETFDLNLYKGINPYINDTPEELYNKVCYVETSRGCPYKCEFCLASLDNKVRFLPIDDIKANLFYLMKHGRVIKFLDRTFNVKRDFTIDMFSYILKHHEPNNVFQFEITADILHADIVQYIHNYIPKGLFRFEIGIQTVNQKANLEVSRKQNFDKTSGIIKQLDYKIDMHLDLIVGLPLDYFEDIKYSFEEVFKLHPPELQLGFLKFLKGTPVRHKSAQHNYVYDPVAPYQIIESNYLSKDELSQIVLLEEALEIYWNKNRAQHTFRYVTQQYSVFDFMLGLGNLFHEKSDFHKHTLQTIYDLLFEFAEKNYGDDIVLKELIAIDYYLQHKIKPQINFVHEVEKTERNTLIEKLHLHHQKFRFVILEIHFDFTIFRNENRIVKSIETLIIQYNGTSKPTLVETNNVVVM